jgi:predicted RNase H-like nuclease (RuvC/YqgF family)
MLIVVQIAKSNATNALNASNRNNDELQEAKHAAAQIPALNATLQKYKTKLESQQILLAQLEQSNSSLVAQVAEFQSEQVLHPNQSVDTRHLRMRIEELERTLERTTNEYTQAHEDLSIEKELTIRLQERIQELEDGAEVIIGGGLSAELERGNLQR